MQLRKNPVLKWPKEVQILSECGVIPIWPHFVSLIYAGIKKFEYRKIVPKNNISFFFIYETAPVSTITGGIEISNFLIGEPHVIWEKTGQFSGISKENFFTYFSTKTVAYAWEIGKATRFDVPLSLSDLEISIPQTIRYLHYEWS